MNCYSCTNCEKNRALTEICKPNEIYCTVSLILIFKFINGNKLLFKKTIATTNRDKVTNKGCAASCIQQVSVIIDKVESSVYCCKSGNCNQSSYLSFPKINIIIATLIVVLILF